MCLTHLDCDLFPFFSPLELGSCICPKTLPWQVGHAAGHTPKCLFLESLTICTSFFFLWGGLSKCSVKLIFLKPLFFRLVIFLFMKNDCLPFDSSPGIFTHLSLEQGSHFLVSAWFGWHHRAIINLWVSWKYFRGNLKQKQRPTQSIQLWYLLKIIDFIRYIQIGLHVNVSLLQTLCCIFLLSFQRQGAFMSERSFFII